MKSVVQQCVLRKCHNSHLYNQNCEQVNGRRQGIDNKRQAEENTKVIQEVRTNQKTTRDKSGTQGTHEDLEKGRGAQVTHGRNRADMRMKTDELT